MVNKQNRHFFYNKNGGKTPRKNCFWIEYGIKKYLVSYTTIVCSIDNRGKFEKYWDDYSATTMNQINAFIGLQYHDSVMRSDTGDIINSINKYDWVRMETSKLETEAYEYIRQYLPSIEYGYAYSYDYVVKITYAK